MLASREFSNADKIDNDRDETPIDCQWDEWRYGECSKTCGGGSQINIRNKKIEAANGGEDCSGKSTNTTTCNGQPCPGRL